MPRLALAVAVVAVMVAVVWAWAMSDAATGTGDRYEGGRVLSLDELELADVEEVVMEAGREPDEFVRALLGRRRPAVIRSASLGPQWSAEVLARWTADHVADAAGTLRNVLANSTTGQRFYYVDNLKPLLAGVDDVSWRQPYQVLDSVPAAAFLSEHADKAPDDIPFGHHMYMSRAAAELAPALRAELQPFVDVLPDGAGPAKVWLSSPGVTAHLHHDNSDNLFMQVRGRKRFVLVDPLAWDSLYMFSSLHPATRQAQIDVEALDLHAFPAAADALAVRGRRRHEGFVNRGYSVVLEPGDMLWLPAYWLHHVTALDMSVSVMSFVSRRHKDLVANATFGEPLPLNVSPPARQLLTLWTWLCLVIDGTAVKPDLDVLGDFSLNRVISSGARFVSALLTSRFAHLADDAILVGASVAAPPSLDPAVLAARGASATYCRGAARSDFVIAGSKSRVFTPLAAQASRVSSQFNKLEPGVRDIALAYYIESVTDHFVPTADVATYLAECFVRPMER
ncbi:uncharacterized protein AMSG_02125 [Thecamonas trahens ATCC 50062]|uniref:JmjC domain-containing protein n=1 Tax=Thecamonas trahens ATCC 50062 TaxID=461836 RepID=A0A0L0DV70_THETB|nr:hypothetical protein AMSG_02125 [Thecamonas trahens ATCC 50062]KNC56110.1 hypothetical protein AMSG_02125 [Thecamonas trahens ATCC 50062]|eukprot:XP_013761152.1 hypothetical protein AMSG_02125 [Thecamonas trahens ATCC 50062]